MNNAETGLSLIIKIKPGDTINIATNEVCLHRSWYTFVVRNWYRENKTVLMDWIVNVIKMELIKYTQTYQKPIQKKIKGRLTQAITGLRNLCSTYYGTDIVPRLEQLIDTIEQVIKAKQGGYSDTMSISLNDSVIVIDTRFGRSY